ncbi:hypothetical protein BRADI_5g21850v3 [Brachypodium distachyon]|uniref:Uncharacterized protein n=1 Tax=Brachypodium distachyon TaxID=15368 RepID=A0A2K2CIJ6_BRADI|nr:hypothetical protein BRADI_5g21850v3 [Brachypodium distachyon]
MAGSEAVERAHELYRGGRHREALELYTAALAAARGHPAQRIALHSNRAACYLKLHDFHKALAPIPESEEESLYGEDDKEDLPQKENKNEALVTKCDQPSTKLIIEKKPPTESPKVDVPPSLPAKPQGWETIEKPKGHLGLDYSKWDKVEDDSSEDDEDDDEDDLPQYKFKVRTIGVRPVK